MTSQSDQPADVRSPITAGVAALSGIVFLLAFAGLLNVALGHTPAPPALQKAAVVTHLATILLALPLGISQLLLPKGTLRHRTVGYIWLALMMVTALISFGIHTIVRNGLSPIHLLSIVTLIFVPIIALQARTGRVEHHRRSVLGLIIGGLVIAGFFTFVPGRVLGQLLVSLIHPT